MSMRVLSSWMTICEIYRKINDLSQTDSDSDKKIRELCVLGIMVGKRLSLEVPSKRTVELVKKGPFHQDDGEKSVRLRTSLGFKDDWCRREEIKEKYGMEE